MPAPDPHRGPGKNKRPRPYSVWERWKIEPGSWHAKFWKADADGWTDWRRLKRYRTEADALIAIEHFQASRSFCITEYRVVIE